MFTDSIISPLKLLFTGGMQPIFVKNRNDSTPNAPNSISNGRSDLLRLQTQRYGHIWATWNLLNLQPVEVYIDVPPKKKGILW